MIEGPSSPASKAVRTDMVQNEDLTHQVLRDTLVEAAARDGPTDCCVICLDSISEPCELLPCGHNNFDYLCLMSWLIDTPLCPLCKSPTSRVLHGPPHDRKATPIESKPKAPDRGPADPQPLHHHHHHHRRRERPRPTTSWGESHAARSLEAAVATRRQVYLHRRYSKHVGSNRVSRYRELTPAMFRADEELTSRARMWTRRELHVFSFLSPDGGRDDDSGPASHPRTAADRRRAGNGEFLLEYIVAILKSVDVVGSAGQAEDMLSDFLGRDNARLFWHELRAWLRSPYTRLEDWDRAVQYDPLDGRDLSADPNSSAGRHHKTGLRRGPDLYRPQSSRRRQASRHEPYTRGRT